jgi:ADYC domain
LRLLAYLLIALLAATFYPALGQEAASASSLEVIGTLFKLTTPEGHILTSPDLTGAILDATDETGRMITVRIDAVTKNNAADPDDDIWLHRFSIRDGGGWREFCTPGPDGTVAGFPVAGIWTADGRHLRGSGGFTITCTSGAVGKCIRLGYKPWGEKEGESLWDYHQACVRMLRADYGGDGISHTRDGMAVDIVDRLGIQQPAPKSGGHAFEFEAAWGPDGAVCVRRTRVAEILSTQELAERYPHLASRIGPECSETVGGLMWNRS